MGDAEPMRWCEEKRKEWTRSMEDEPWRNDELRILEEGILQLKEDNLQRVLRSCKAPSGAGCDGRHPGISLDLSKETRRGVVEFLQQVEHSVKWPQQACTPMFFSLPWRGPEVKR